MRVLVHYHSYGDSAKVGELVDHYSGLIQRQIDLREEDAVGRLIAETEEHAERFASAVRETDSAQRDRDTAGTKKEASVAEARIVQFGKQIAKLGAKLDERDARIAEARRLANEDRLDVLKVGAELVAMYADPLELVKHARVVDMDEIAENEFNLNIPRYVDTFEPEAHVDVNDALSALRRAHVETELADKALMATLQGLGYGAE
jgi:type I restriction enzyme M protein